MRCHICNGFTNDVCSICGNYTCSLCMEDDICKRCSMNYSYINFPRLANITNPLLFIVGISLVFIGFVFVAFSFMQDIPSNDGFIFIFPFVFIESPEPIILLSIILLFIALPIILMFIFMRYRM